MKRGQASLEYFFMIAVSLVIIVVVVSMLTRSVHEIPSNQVIVPWIDPEDVPHYNMSDEYFVYNVYVEPVGDNLYKVVYKLTAKKTLFNVKVHAILKCEKEPAYIDPKYLHITEYYERIPKGYYVSNYWTPIKTDEFPCQVAFNVWVSSG